MDTRSLPLLSRLARFSRSIVAIISCELRLQLRGIAFWLFMLVTCAFSNFFTILYHRPTTTLSASSADFSAQSALSIVLYSSMVGLLGLSFLYSRIFARDQRYKVRSLLWSRPLFALDYALGKTLAVLLLSILVAVIPMLIGWLVCCIASATLLLITPWLSILAALIPGYVLIGLFSLLCISLTSIPFLGSLLSAGVVIFLVIILSQTMLEPINIALQSVYYAPEIAFGPDTALLERQSLFFAALTLLCVGILMLIFQLRERFALRSLGRWISSGILIMLALLVSFLSLGHFQSLASGYDDPTGYPEEPVEAQVSHYRLSIAGDTSNGALQGQATFVLTPEKPGLQTVSLLLSRGLHIQPVQVKEEGAGGEHAVPTQTKDGWTSINLAHTAYAQGKPLHVRITYDGLLTMNRYNYATPAAGFIYSSFAELNADMMSYLGQDIAFLQGVAGTWYPLPWVQSVLSRSGGRPAIEDLRVRLPAQVEVFSSLGNTHKLADGSWQELHAQPEAGLPMAVLAAISHPQHQTITGMPVFMKNATLSTQNIGVITSSLKALQQLDTWLAARPGQAILRQVIVLPLLKQPVIGKGLVLLPDQDPYQIPGADNQSSISAQITSAWWLDALIFPLHYDKFNISGTQDSRTEMHVLSPLQNLLANYTSGVVTDHLLGHNWEEKQIAFAKKLHQVQQQNKPAQNGEASPAEQNVHSDMLAELGIYDSPYDQVALYELAKKNGNDGVTRILREFTINYSLPGRQAINMHTFVAYASQLIGHDISREFAPYICPDNPTGTAAELNACLDQ